MDFDALFNQEPPEKVFNLYPDKPIKSVYVGAYGMKGAIAVFDYEGNQMPEFQIGHDGYKGTPGQYLTNQEYNELLEKIKENCSPQTEWHTL